MASEHTADEAGGEAIFSSDGLPSLSSPPPPILGIRPIESDRERDGDVVVEETADPIGLFESFVVKSDAERGWGILSSDELQRVDRIMTVDDPRRRLFRLRAEIYELEEEMAKQAPSGEGIDDFRAMSNELKSHLESMGIGGDSSLTTMLRGRQADLSRVISRDMEKFASPDVADATQEGEKGKIVYELYRSEASTSYQEASFEERLRHLEVAVGSGEGTSLFERVDDVLKLAKEVDAKEVEKVAAKAKVIRSDLEAAARAKAKLSSSNNTSLTTQDSQTISSLHNQLVELEGISAYLPALTSRLAELSNLHSNAAEFGSRLDAAEETLARSEALLTNLEEALGKMERGWKENMEVVERNVKCLDEIVAGK